MVKEVNWLGDLVISLPALRAVRRRFPEAHLAVLVNDGLSGFFDGFDWIDEVIPYRLPSGLRKFAAQREIIAAIRARRFDLAVLFPNSFSSALWMALARVPGRAGYATDARGLLLTKRARPDSRAIESHQVQYWLSMVEQTIEAQGDAADCVLIPAARNLARMRAMLADHRKNPASRLIAIAPAAAYGPAKEWPADRYARLIELLTARNDVECILIGAPAERQRCELIAGMSHGNAVVTAGETGIGDLIAILSLCDGFVGNDSGAMHLAGAVGIPTVAIFGSTNPSRTGPLGPRVEVIHRPPPCSPCLRRTCRFDHYECLTRIEPQAAADALRGLGAIA